MLGRHRIVLPASNLPHDTFPSRPCTGQQTRKLLASVIRLYVEEHWPTKTCFLETRLTLSVLRIGSHDFVKALRFVLIHAQSRLIQLMFDHISFELIKGIETSKMAQGL